MMIEPYQLFNGDCLEVLKTLAANSVQCCVTSPPYFGLRDYGVDGQIGLESSPTEYVQKMVEVFAEVWRVLRKDGTLWLNLGDSYAGSGKGPTGHNGIGSQEQRQGFHSPKKDKLFDFKPKDLIGIPWRVAFALQDFGWYLRQDIIWHKPNPMPESVTDRCTKSHEYIFLLSKSQNYFYDHEAIKEPLKDASIARLIQDVENQNGSSRVPGKTNGNMKAVRFGGNKYGDSDEGGRTYSGKEWNPSQAGGGAINKNRSGYFDKDTGEPLCGIMANKKSVWTVTTRPFKDAHFATFPEKLIEPCILAGSRAEDLILDPFNGAGTTGLVALKHHRQYVGIELNPEYIEITNRRFREIQPKLIFS
jgi:DNA modification methylase